MNLRPGNSIGFVLVGGMVIATLFTLFAVPALYSLLASRKTASKEKQGIGSRARGLTPAE